MFLYTGILFAIAINATIANSAKATIHATGSNDICCHNCLFNAYSRRYIYSFHILIPCIVVLHSSHLITCFLPFTM